MTRSENIERQVAALLRDLSLTDPSYGTRSTEGVSDEGIGTLVGRALADEALSTEAVSRALWLLPKFPSARGVELAMSLLKTRPDVALGTGSVLGEVGDRSIIPSMEAALLDKSLSAASRAGAARALGELGELSSKPVLRRALRVQEQDDVVLDNVAEALGRMHEQGADAADDLAALLTSRSADVRFSVICALGNIEARQAVEKIEPLINDNELSSYGPVGAEALRVCQWLRRP